MTRSVNPRSEPPEWSQLEAFVAVCDTGSMALAARHLGLSASAISQSIQALEQHLGLALLDRDVRPAQPTRAGRELHAAATALLAQASSMVEEVRAVAMQEQGRLRLGCIDSVAATLGPRLIQGLAQQSREIQLGSGLSPQLAEQLLGREIDRAICSEVDLRRGGAQQRLLFTEPWVAVFGRSVGLPKGMDSRATVLSRSSLQQAASAHALIRYSQRSVIGQQIERYVQHLGVQAPQLYAFDATDPLLSLVASGLGWALTTPLCLWQSRQYLDEVLIYPLPASRLGQRHVYLLSRSGSSSRLDREIERIVRHSLVDHLNPAMQRAMPKLRDVDLCQPA